MTAVLPVDETRIMLARRDEIRTEVQADPDKKWDLSELRSLNQALKAQIELHVALLEQWSAPPEKLRNGVLHSRSHGDLVQSMTYHELDSLIRESHGNEASLYDRGVRLFASPVCSAVDLMGGDFLLVDTLTGNYLLLDATARCDKSSMGLPQVRLMGLIANNELAIHLRDFGISDAAFSLRKRLVPRLTKLMATLKASPLNLLDLRLPLTESVGVVWTQIDELKQNFERSKADALLVKLSRAAEKLNGFCVDLEERAQLFRNDDEYAQLTEFAKHLRAPHEDKAIAGALSCLLGAIRCLSELSHKRSQSPFKRRQEARVERIHQVWAAQVVGESDGLPPTSSN
ncbi:MAG: hypothetical protein K2W82_16850 [Candidatus Obscuribacterales bacterium]|nr:hypothetical protein [Candidatus Obscuribacterales bacterium]